MHLEGEGERHLGGLECRGSESLTHRPELALGAQRPAVRHIGLTVHIVPAINLDRAAPFETHTPVPATIRQLGGWSVGVLAPLGCWTRRGVRGHGAECAADAVGAAFVAGAVGLGGGAGRGGSFGGKFGSNGEATEPFPELTVGQPDPPR